MRFEFKKDDDGMRAIGAFVAQLTREGIVATVRDNGTFFELEIKGY